MLEQAKGASDALKEKVPAAEKEAQDKEAEAKKEQEEIAKLEKELAPHTSAGGKQGLEKQVKAEEQKTAALRGQNAKLASSLNQTEAEVTELTASIAELHKEADASASALKAVKDPLREAVAVELSHVDADVLKSPAAEEAKAAPQAKVAAPAMPSAAAPLCAVLAFVALA